jgi:hypothetical protein
MFGNALDNMLSQYSQNRGGQPASSPVSSPTPTRFYDTSSQSPALFGGGGGSNPNSFFNAASNVTAGANSTGSSPFGALVPDLRNATPDQLKYITDTLSHLTYDVGAGGYLDSRANYGNTNFDKGGYFGRTVNLPNQPQLDASNVYSLIGSLPTKPRGTPALNALPGYVPSQGPSYNTQLGGPYSGPLAFPNWRNNG